MALAAEDEGRRVVLRPRLDRPRQVDHGPLGVAAPVMIFSQGCVISNIFLCQNDSLEFILALQQVSVVVGIFYEDRVALLVALFLYLKSDLEHNRHLK